jgi:hypothetical protein
MNEEMKMNASSRPPTLEEFSVQAKLTGLKLSEEDVALLHEAYVALHAQMSRIPDLWAWAPEPPYIFRADV